MNGEQVNQPGTRVHPERDVVSFDGERVVPPGAETYLVLNKPGGYLVSRSDPHHRQTVYDLLKDVAGSVFPVGRLDLDTLGVLLFTDDGDLGYRLAHPRYGVLKTYRATVKGVPDPDVVRQLCEGVRLDDGVTSPAEARLLSDRGDTGVLELILHEGRKRQVRRMCSTVGHRVLELERTAFGGITARGLDRGAWRALEEDEVESLRRMAGLR